MRRDGYTVHDRRIVIRARMPVLIGRRHAGPGKRRRPGAGLQRRLGAGGASHPAAATGSGTLTVESRPAGANVLLDGRAIGTTPLNSQSVPAGLHAIRLELDGYRVWAGSVRITANEPARVRASLER